MAFDVQNSDGSWGPAYFAGRSVSRDPAAQLRATGQMLGWLIRWTPEERLDEGQILVLQVPLPEPLRLLEPRESETRRMHAEMDYTRMWLFLYESVVSCNEIMLGAGYPVLVNGRHIMSPSPIPRWDVPRLNMAPNLFLFGAGRERRIYAVPPHTSVVPLEFEDYPFKVEDFRGERCRLCGSGDTFLSELVDGVKGERTYVCSDTAHCRKRARCGS